MTDFKKAREEYKLQKSKEKLLSLCASKVTTTMIGALSDIEKILGDFLEQNPEFHEQLRSSILDRGNAQIRNLKVDLDSYDVVYKKQTLTTNIYFPVKPREDNNGI